MRYYQQRITVKKKTLYCVQLNHFSVEFFFKNRVSPKMVLKCFFFIIKNNK